MQKEIAKLAVYIEKKVGRRSLNVQEVQQETLLNEHQALKTFSFSMGRVSSWDVAEWIVKTNSKESSNVA